MPILNDFRKTKEIVLPSFPDSKVVIWSGILFGDLSSFSPGDDVKHALDLLPKLIKEWNFTEPFGASLLITGKSLGLLPIEDIGFLMNEIKAFAAAQKKT